MTVIHERYVQMFVNKSRQNNEIDNNYNSSLDIAAIILIMMML